MKTLICDVCRKKLGEPGSGAGCFHLAHRDICEACKDELEMSIKPVIRTKDPFSYDWYIKLVQESLEKAVQKGKF